MRQDLNEDGEAGGLQFYERVALKLVENGEAETIGEAVKLQSQRARRAFDEKYSEEEKRKFYVIGAEAAAQKFIDSGEAKTLKEAFKHVGERARRAFEAKYSEAERSELARKGATKVAQKLVDSGEAATIEEAFSIVGKRANQKRLDRYTEAELYQMNSAAGVKTALLKGHRTRYPGVRWQKRQGKTGTVLDEGSVDPETTRGFWRVTFSYKGKRISVGSGYADEEEAARAHDAFVIENNITRKLHFLRRDGGAEAAAAA